MSHNSHLPLLVRLALALISLQAGLASCAAVPGKGARIVQLRGVRLVDVDTGSVSDPMVVECRGDRITAIGTADEVPPRPTAQTVEAAGRYLIPGLWDMHVHSHRDGRAERHDPLYVAHGVVGVREMGTHLGSALAAREGADDGRIAPRVWWTSPVVDGPPPVLSHGLVAEDAESARALVRALARLGFNEIKVYDRLSRESYFALADEARRAQCVLVGHVPLQVTPTEAARAGQRSIEHLTLVLEACIPGALAWSAADQAGDSMALLSDGRLAAALDRFDPRLERALAAEFVRHGVWQVPTLVQMRGAFHADDLAADASQPLHWVPESTRRDWEEARATLSAAEATAGRAVLRRQTELVGELHALGVGLLAGTDTSDEPWVFAGASLHEELALFVSAGLTPVEALRTATSNPARYRGDPRPEGSIAVGASADLVLLSEDPTLDIRALDTIEGVLLRGRWLDRAELDRLLAEAAEAAEAAETGGNQAALDLADDPQPHKERPAGLPGLVDAGVASVP